MGAASNAPNPCVDPRIPLGPPEGFPGDSAEFERRVEARLQTLKSCADRLTRAASLRVVLEPGPANRVEHVLVTASSTDDCDAISCVKQGLTGVEAPAAANARAWPLIAQVSLSPHAAPTVERPPHPIAEPVTPSCVDQQQQRPGRMPPALIQSIVRAHYDKIRHCYEVGLGRNSRLTGRISVRFVIGRDGSVSYSSISESTLPDCQVAACVRDEFRALSFPPPEDGIVTVVYPIVLEPG